MNARMLVGIVFLSAVGLACGGGAEAPPATTEEVADVTAAVFTGSLAASATSVAAGTPFTVTESAINLTGAQQGPIIVGINRVGFTVTAAQKPRTGICRIAGSATCNFLELAPYETQTYTLTLVGTTPGTYQIKGWTTSSYLTGGFSGSVTVTVH